MKNTRLVIFSVLMFILVMLQVMPYAFPAERDVPENTYMVDFYRKHSLSVVKVYGNFSGRVNSGSGVYITRHILVTNYHVVKYVIENKNTKVLIVTPKGVEVGVVVAIYPEKDLAFVETLKVKGFPAILGDSSTLSIGEKVVSIGSSKGHYNTLGVGYITGLHRIIPLPGGKDVISVSTGIMPGNSGGAVFNWKGELVGVSFAGTNGLDNLGFMIPINLVKEKFKTYLEK